MENHPYAFPFGKPVTKVKQQPDGLKKRAFVVGIYSSAVHARWFGPDGRLKVAALAVASEPNIFWTGDSATEQIPMICPHLGRLEAAGEFHNGLSGRALDERYLKPLGINREDVWLSDLVPTTLSNKGQQEAIAKHYQPITEPFGLPKATVQPVPSSRAAWEPLIDTLRLRQELKESQARTIVALGSIVIEKFLNLVCKKKPISLSHDSYGLQQEAIIDDISYNLICLAHMRVTTIKPIPSWKTTHSDWISHMDPKKLID